jgi:ferrochelatase
MAHSVRLGLAEFPDDVRDDVLLLFSAHSLPLDIINRGDAYPQEIGASVQAVMEALGFSHEFMLSFQSAVGPVKWMGPNTAQIIAALGRKGRKHVLVVPIAFVSDHIETLSEIDLEYGELAHKAGITNFKRAPALNAEPLFQRALADIVASHLKCGELCSSQYALRCAGCANPLCRTILNPALPDDHPLIDAPFSPKTYHRLGRQMRLSHQQPDD